MSEQVKHLRVMVRGAYDLQKLRIQMGLRLCANFRARLGGSAEEDLVEEDGEKKLSAKAEGVIKRLKQSYKRLTDGVARNRTLPAREGFNGDEVIADYAELILVDQYLRLERDEATNFRQLEEVLDQIPIYTSYLKNQRGIGPAMAGVLIAYFDPAKARHMSSFWKYGGLDVAPDGAGRSRREEHLVEREYKNKRGKKMKRMGITYEPFLKSKLTGVLAGSFLRSTSPWRSVYDGYRHRLESDPARKKITVEAYKKLYEEGEPTKHLWTPGRIHKASARYMVKMFLAEFWTRWRGLEGLPVTAPYAVAKLGQPPHLDAAE